MKKASVIAIAIVLLSTAANSQITKGNWLIGGNAEFSTSKTTTSEGTTSGLYISATPKIGYFLIDKLGAGLLLSYSHSTSTYNNMTSKFTNLGIGPFVRYYLLPVDNRVNILCESNFELHAFKHDHNSTSTFTSYRILAGPTVFFNSSAGIEMLIGYKEYREKNNVRDNGIYMSIGFQLYLEKK